MKRIVFFVSIVISVSCAQIDSAEDEMWNADSSVVPAAITLTRTEMQVSHKDAEFGINLFKDIYSLDGSKNDILISPFSASMVLSIIAEGAKGETYNQIADVLGFKNLPVSEVQSYYKKVTDRLTAPNGRVNLSVANAIWSGLNFKPDFADAAKYYYNADIQKIDFGKNEDATKRINEWTAEKTHNMIGRLFENTLPEYTKAIFENALYFKGQWCGDFITSTGKFRALGGKSTDITFFGIDEYWLLDSYFDKDVSILQLPYKDNSYKMMFILPAEDSNLTEFISGLTAEKWNMWKDRISQHELKFRVPCFDAKYAMNENFAKALQKRGITLAFSDEADFSNMYESKGGCRLDNIIQKTAIKLNEKGSEAGASSVVYLGEIEDEPSRFDFIADRPFVYAIVEEGSGAILFMGVHVK